MKTVLYVIDSLFTGGSEFSTLLLARWMQERGYVVRIVLLKVKLPAWDPQVFGFRKEDILLLKPGSIRLKYKQLSTIIQQYQPDVVHSVLTTSGFLCRVLRIFSGGFKHIESLVNQPYSDERLHDPKLKTWKIRLLQLFDRFTEGKGVDAFHANSEAVALHYCRTVGVPSFKLTVIPRGRKPNDFIENKLAVRSSVLEELQIKEPCLLFLNTGRQEHQKGQDLLLKAVANLPTSYNWYLLVAGREGAETGILQRLVRQLNLEERVQFLGHRTDVTRLLAAADLFVFPSRFEGMPGAMIEACAAGLPIVCTDLPCMTEVVEPGANAAVFPPEDVLALTSQLQQLLGNPEQRKSMGEKSRELFQSKFNLESIHQRMEQLYHSVISIPQ